MYVLLSALVACGPPPVEPVAAPLPPPKPASSTTLQAAARAEADVPIPEDLSFVVRIADMDRLKGEVFGAFPQVAGIFGNGQDLEALLALAVGREAANAIDAAYGIDIASMKNDRYVVVSFGARADAEAKLAEHVEGTDERGVMTLKQSSGRGAFKHCALVPATKPAARVMCSDDAGALDAASAYLARSVSSELLDADVRLSVTKNVLRSKSKRASSGALEGLTKAFETELDRIEVDLKLRSDLEIAATLRLSSRTSALARAVVPSAKPTTPPAAFFRLPKETVFALHVAGGTADDLRPLREALAADSVAAVKQDGYGDDGAQAFADQASQLFLTGGPLVFASGLGASGLAGVEKAVADAKDKTGEKDDPKVLASLVPWSLGWVDEPAAKWTTGIKQMVKTAEDAEKTRNKKQAQRAPPKDSDGTHTALRLAPKVDAKWRLPEGSLEVLVDRTPRAPKSKTTTSRLFVVPKGNATWFGYGEDGALVAERLRFVLDDKQTKGTLADVPEAAALRAKSGLAAATLQPLGAMLGLGEASSPHRLRRILESAGKTSSKGRDVLTFTAASDVTGDRAQLKLVTIIPRRAFVDFVNAALGP